MFEYMKWMLVGRTVCTVLFSLCFAYSDGQEFLPKQQVPNLVSYSFTQPTPFKLPPALSFDSVVPKQSTVNRKRVRLLTIGNIAAYTGSMLALNQLWYADYPRSSFHFFNDNHEWLQVDKVGHAFSAYVASRASMEMWRWAGLNRKQRIWIGGTSGAVYQTIIETLDGFSAEWGWSWGDFAANTFGSGLVFSQELLWDEQRISFKFSTTKRNYPSGELGTRANELYGKSFTERMFKDYNAQTLWLSANLKSFFRKSNLPPWLNIAVGYGADGMYGGDDNTWVDKTGLSHDRRDITRYRQLYISPDIDLTRIKTRSKPLKVVLFVLNSFKFPAPALELSQGKLKGHWLHF